MLILFGAIHLFSSCKDEVTELSVSNGYLNLKINEEGVHSRAYVGENQEGAPDKIVRTLRILVFDKNNGNIIADPTIGNQKYDIINTYLDVVRHPVALDAEYTMVFLANEPDGFETTLNGITSLNTLKQIAYPESAFTSDKLIPMIQVIEGVKILSGGKAKLANGTLTDINGKTRTANATEGLYPANAETETLILRLDRLAVRLNVTLQSGFNMGDDFKGITLSNMPDKVPLFQVNYGGTITNDIERTYAATAFSTTSASGMEWERTLDRIVIPANHLPQETNALKATKLTVNLPDDKYSPSCELKIMDDNYNLPYNTWLDFNGTVKKPLEVNIVAKDWTNVLNNWQIAGSRVLNVSQTEASITNLNGVRISFYSNMPKVKVDGTVKKGDGTTFPTNQIFNCLAIDANNPDPYRFYYDPATGAGYMDLLLDGTTKTGDNVNGAVTEKNVLSGTYTLTLSAEDEDGNSKLQKTINVTINQSGLLIPFYPPGNTHAYYSGAFYRHNQKGERIITGQRQLDYTWSVTVPAAYRNWLIVSATPSFDPTVGTASPGDPEKYPVTPNPYKENGYSISGLKGRIYFRIGIKEDANFVANEESEPKYGYVELRTKGGSTWDIVAKIYVRQGEAADYIYREEDIIPEQPKYGWNETGDLTIEAKYRPLGGQERKAAAKFSPFNLTTEKIYNGAWPYWQETDVKGARFVDYPTQAGALFQWAMNIDEKDAKGDFFRRAYSPSVGFDGTRDALFDNTAAYNTFPALWDGGDLVYESNPNVNKPGLAKYSDEFEVCPTGYRRPTDGPTDGVAFNGEYIHPGITTVDYGQQIAQSELRVSLFYVPFAGNVASNSNYHELWPDYILPQKGTYPYADGNARKQLKGTKFALYADGFFDRRPLERRINATSGASYTVSAEPYGNGQVAHQGVLYCNDATNASIFLPSAGRINNDSKKVQSNGTTGYYWSASAGPQYVGNEFIGTDDKGDAFNRTIRYAAWALESSYNTHQMISSYTGFGQSIRCVKDE
ncbi:hypothetical protein D0T87_12745 [Bacteroides sp. 51]|nr:hypothetical protein [Bacteroides sp. 51]